jgi:hypothetical protein
MAYQTPRLIFCGGWAGKSMLPMAGGLPFICGQDIVKVSLVRENGL